jgi:hypothetical protein
MSIEAMKLALEALENVRSYDKQDLYRLDEDITALRTAIAEAEKQQPVAYVTGYYGGRCVIEPLNPAMVMPSGMALYTTPPAATTGKQTPVAYRWKGELFTPSEIEMLDVDDAVPLYQHTRASKQS